VDPYSGEVALKKGEGEKKLKNHLLTVRRLGEGKGAVYNRQWPLRKTLTHMRRRRRTGPSLFQWGWRGEKNALKVHRQRPWMKKINKMRTFNRNEKGNEPEPV